MPFGQDDIGVKNLSERRVHGFTIFIIVLCSRTNIVAHGARYECAWREVTVRKLMGRKSAIYVDFTS